MLNVSCRVRRAANVLVLGVLAFGAFLMSSCEIGRTHPQVNLVLDADPDVRAVVYKIQLQVYGAETDFPTQLRHEEEFDVWDDATWQRTFALAPLDGNTNRNFRFVIRGIGDLGDGERVIIQRGGFGWYTWDSIETLKVTLTGDCLDVFCPNAQWSCEQARCVESRIDFYNHDRSCTDTSQCDDSVECTIDACEDGYCTHFFDDSYCRSDQACLPWGCNEGENFFACGGSEFTRREYVCDGVFDCDNGADEARCFQGEFCYGDNLRPLPFVNFCDGNEYCSDGYDELGHICPEGGTGMRACPNGSGTVSVYALCDGTLDCADGSDEESWYCYRRFLCDSADAWVEPYEVCDGNLNCLDGSDELYCEIIHGGLQ